LDGSTRACLAIVRSLGKCNIEVIVGGSEKHSRSFYSRYCSGHFLYPEPHGDGSVSHEIIKNKVKTLRPHVVLPIFTNTTLLFLRYIKEYLLYTRLIPLPSYETYIKFNDKASFLRLAQENGLPVPQTYYPQSLGDVEAIGDKVSYPVLLKPRISSGGYGIVKVSNRAELIKFYSEMIKLIKKPMANEPFDPDYPIIQKYIHGPSFTMQGFCEQGSVKAMFITQSLRRYPMPFGPSIAYKSVKHERIRSLCVDFLKKLRWHGPIILSFVADGLHGSPYVIEANPRLGGTIESAIASGVDIPYLLVNSALNIPTSAIFDYKEGTRFRWVLFGELFYLRDTPHKLKALREFIDFKNTRCEISINDSVPHFVHLFNLLRNRIEVR